ncbi:MAG: 4Fe-4S binding protein [bacterium]|nr:4Fe-4S binding protein [bacterium]
MSMRLYSRYFSIACLGFFGILAQALLFRTFLITFDGNELFIGLFFFSWLIWVCVGALIGRINICSKFADYFWLVILIYIPAYFIQNYLLLNVQLLLGTKSFELISIQTLISYILIFNAPISFFTGFLFVIGSKWMSGDRTPVIKVYLGEALGSFVGAFVVTILLFSSMSEQNIYIIASLVLIFSSLLYLYCSARTTSIITGRILLSIIFIIGILFISLDYSSIWTKKNNTNLWKNLLHEGSLKGSFTTSQAKYLYGLYKDQFVVLAWNSTYEVLPNSDSSIEFAVSFLAQKPDAENILVIGPGSYSICRFFSKLQQIKKITWFDTDSEYSRKFIDIVPQKYTIKNNKLIMPNGDIKSYLSSTGSKYDIIILYLQEPSNLITNRYYTFEFFKSIKNALTDVGIAGITFPGAENFLGTELSYIGGSLYYTLKQVFSNIALKPGNLSCFFVAKNHNIISDKPKILTKRLSVIKGLTEHYNYNRISSVFNKNRLDFQLLKYRSIVKNNTSGLLLNSDKNPKSFLYTLLYSIKKLSNYSLPESSLKKLMTNLFSIILFGIILYFLIRVYYYYYYGVKLKSKPIGPHSQDIYFAVLTSAVLGMGITVLLMFLFQVTFGSLFLYFGLITALFMLGLFIGGLLTSFYFRKFNSLYYVRYSLVSGLMILFLILLYFYPPFYIISFSLYFFIAGFLTGLFIPLAAIYFKDKKITSIKSASKLELLDHFGGALGSIIFSIILIPILGLSYSILIMVLLLLLVFFHSIILRNRVFEINNITSVLKHILRIVSVYIWAVVLIIVFIGYLWNKEADKTESDWKLNHSQLIELAGKDHKFLAKHIIIDKKNITYYEIFTDNDQHSGYVFNSNDFANERLGYAGPINLLSFTDKEGTLNNFIILDSNETPKYLDIALKNKSIFINKNSDNGIQTPLINAVTGATVSSVTISKNLNESGQNFSLRILEKKARTADFQYNKSIIYYSIIIFLFFSVAAILIRIKPNPYIRNIYLLVCFLVLGLIYNLQYSSDHIFNLLVVKFTWMTFLSASALILIVPILIVLFGNIYCGYLCPFGALQEIIFKSFNYVFKLFRLNTFTYYINKKTWLFTRTIKYIILLLFIILFFIYGKEIAILADLLIYVFLPLRTGSIWFLIIFVLFVSIFYKRLWCRCICPVGAFLSLINVLSFIKILIPRVNINKCDLGVMENDIDCISCDRCRIKSKDFKYKKSTIYNMIFIFAVLVLSIYTIVVSIQGISEYYKKQQSYVQKTKPVAEQKLIDKPGEKKEKVLFHNLLKIKPSHGETRKINLGVYKSLINKNYLSNKKAKYYRVIND